MISLNFNSSIGHFIDGLIDDDGCVRLSHNFVDLVAFGAYQERDHSFWDKNDDRKWLPSDLFKDLIDITEEDSTALVFLFHFFIVNLEYYS